MLTIIGSIIKLTLLLLPVLLAAIAARNTPKALEKKANDEIDAAIVNGDTDAINVLLHDKLQNRSGSDTGGQGSKI